MLMTSALKIQQSQCPIKAAQDGGTHIQSRVTEMGSPLDSTSESNMGMPMQTQAMCQKNGCRCIPERYAAIAKNDKIDIP